MTSFPYSGGMMVWLLAVLTMAAPARAGGAPRASAASSARPSGVPVVTVVAPIALAPSALSPALTLSAPPLTGAPVVLSAAPVLAPAAAPMAALGVAPRAALEAAPAAAASVVDAPSVAGESAAAAESATSAGALGAARMAASGDGPAFEVVFDGQKPRKPMFSWPTFGRSPRIPAATLTRGGPAQRTERYVQPPVLARRIALVERGAVAGAVTAAGAFTFAGGAVFLALAATFIVLGYLQNRDAAESGRRHIERGVDRHAARFQGRAQRLLDEMREAAGLKPNVTVRISADVRGNAFYSTAFPNEIFLGRGLETFDDAAIRSIMAHELGHRALGDDLQFLSFLRGALKAMSLSAAAALFVGMLLLQGAVPSAVLPLLGAPVVPGLLALAIGLVAASSAMLALRALPRLWEYRADHYAAWMTHPLDMYHALRHFYSRRAVIDRPRFTSTHPDMRRRFIELRGQAAPVAGKGGVPEGVKDAFRKAAVMIGGPGALLAAGWFHVAAAAPQLGFWVYAAAVLPLTLLPAHFALVAGFWGSWWWGYRKAGPSGRAAFRSLWTAAGRLYAGAALLALSGWSWLLAAHPMIFLPLLVVLAFTAGEVVHHFVYRLVPERKADQGKSVLDWRSRVGGNVGQSLRRLSR